MYVYVVQWITWDPKGGNVKALIISVLCSRTEVGFVTK